MKDLNKILKKFETKNDKVICNDKGDLIEFIRKQHEGLPPSDFIFEYIYQCFLELSDWDINNSDSFENSCGEIADSITPIYNHDILAHYREFPDYAEAAKIDNLPSDATVFDCMHMGCYLHCLELLTSCWEFINE